ncbi:hypothetical protein [Mycetocola reblochoni]|uniref:Uncharacterized protein n=2 Tax=Mycetocola reblochoni TaxID=331618 RepID=A0A1R4J8W7_9MICO|nr:hypothetical protein [Mycetocola reblochoni]RLP70107.1 hypothetical protein D9V30_05470 [Mycetocola reblochoni]SJN28419.1 hypothetical protein FM119_06015 [Mycetocola reblochoni REB411]
MELFFVAVIGAVLGAAVRYVLPLRENYGVTVTVATGTAAATLSAAVLELAGLRWDNPLLWIIALVLSVAVPAGIALALSRRREREYAALLSTVAG